MINQNSYLPILLYKGFHEKREKQTRSLIKEVQDRKVYVKSCKKSLMNNPTMLKWYMTKKLGFPKFRIGRKKKHYKDHFDNLAIKNRPGEKPV